MLIPAFDATEGRCPITDLTACARLGLVSFTGSGDRVADRIGRPFEVGVASGPVVARTRWRPRVSTRPDIQRVLARGTAVVVVESDVAIEDLVGLPIDRLSIRIGPGFAEAVEAIVRWRPYVGGFELAWSDDDDSTRSFEVRRRLRRLAGDRDLVIEDADAEVEAIVALDAIGIDVLRPAGFVDGALDPVEALDGLIRSPRRDGRWPALVCDETGRALALASTSPRCVRRMVLGGRIALESGDGIVVSGAAAGGSPEVVAIDVDEARSAVRITVRTAADRRPATARWTGWWAMPPIDCGPLIGAASNGPASLADLARRRQGVILAG